MICSVFIATSIDGFIARKNGDLSWLESDSSVDMGFTKFLSQIDCIIMGRKTAETISKMNLSPNQWPYGERRVIILSSTLKSPWDNIKDRVEIYSGDIEELIYKLKIEGYKHLYIDGGRTIQSFMNLKLITDIIITRVPIILGEGISLFDNISGDINLKEARSKVFVNDYIQVSYKVDYSD